MTFTRNGSRSIYATTPLDLCNNASSVLSSSFELALKGSHAAPLARRVPGAVDATIEIKYNFSIH
ncbi:MAG: hypothetical protein VB140_08380 [Burkholderia sp.]